MNAKYLMPVFALIAVILLLGGCSPQNPGTPIANEPPDTRIVVAPLDSSSHDHYISPEPMFHIQWFGADPDGFVTGYYVKIDNNPEFYTTKGDSALSFQSLTPDPAHPGKTLPEGHTLKVAAIDNLGLRDPSPASRYFKATNEVPEFSDFTADFGNNTVVGQGIGFSVAATDSNPSWLEYRVYINGVAATGWVDKSDFRFCKSSDPTILAALNQTTTYPVDISKLPLGADTLEVMVRDGGNAVGTAITRVITVVDTTHPQITKVNAAYGEDLFYVDGSIFYAAGKTTTVSVTGSALSYAGSVAGFRYRYYYRPVTANSWTDSLDWSNWLSGSATLNDLPAGTYELHVICRDFAGNESEPYAQKLSLVEPQFSAKTLLVVDETRNGNGNQGSPTDTTVDNFYRRILQVDTTNWTTATGWKVTELDYDLHKVGNSKYVSPLDVYNKRVILWHADDKSELQLRDGDNIRLLEEYLGKGGRLILCGQDVLGPFTALDSTSFSSGFVYNYLRVSGGKRDITNAATRGLLDVIGEPGSDYPDTLAADANKMAARWKGLDRCWTMVPRNRTEAIATWHGSTAATPYEGLPVAVKNFNPAVAYKTITLGFPLFFFTDAEAQAFITTALNEIDR